MKLLVLLYLVVSASGAILYQEKNSPSNGRIVGGQNVDISHFPFQVALIFSGHLACGGSILSADFVITAAHCTRSYPVDIMQVRAGSSSWSSGGSLVNVVYKYEHPEYDPDNTESPFDYDVAVLNVYPPLVLHREVNILPVLLPPLEFEYNFETLENVWANVTGWGRTVSGGPAADNLQGIGIKIQKRDSCIDEWSDFTLRMICAKVDDLSQDFCTGDSGGAMVLQGNNILVGLASHRKPGGCEVLSSSVYTNVAQVDIRSFIEVVTGL